MRLMAAFSVCVQYLPLNINTQDLYEQGSTGTSIYDHMYTTTQRLHSNTTYALAYTNTQVPTPVFALACLHEQRG